jgi:hypothetical protein
MTDDERIERAAIALRTGTNRSGRGRPWAELSERARESYRDEARAALKIKKETEQ